MHSIPSWPYGSDLQRAGLEKTCHIIEVDAYNVLSHDIPFHEAIS